MLKWNDSHYSHYRHYRHYLTTAPWEPARYSQWSNSKRCPAMIGLRTRSLAWWITTYSFAGLLRLVVSQKRNICIYNYVYIHIDIHNCDLFEDRFYKDRFKTSSGTPCWAVAVGGGPAPCSRAHVWAPLVFRLGQVCPPRQLLSGRAWPRSLASYSTGRRS